MQSRLTLVRSLLTGFVAVWTTAFPLRSDSLSPGAEPTVPRFTKVLLLRPIDATVDSVVLRPLRQKIVRLRQQYEFISRQFVVVGDGMVDKIASVPPRLDLEQGNERSFELLDELGRRANADWVVSISVREIKADPSDGSEFKVHCTLLVQIRDARRQVWLVDRAYVGYLAGGGPPGRLFIESLRAATGEALAGTVAPYPQVVGVSQDGSIVDYLAGQKAPFVGDSHSLFRGLSVERLVGL